MSNSAEVLLKATKISKRFGATRALNEVDLTVYKGEVRGLIGENGSGKSTLSSILSGMLQPDSGEINFEGKGHKPKTMIEASNVGIGMIVQEMGTISGITVAQNIFLGHEDQFIKWGIVNKQAMNKAAKVALDQIGFYDVEPSMYIDALNMQDRKLVEVAKVMYSNPKILIVDETTTALSHKGRNIIYGIMDKMKKEGKAVLFISHDLNETMEHCDALTVLRDGQLVTTVIKADMNEKTIKHSMVGRDMGERYYRLDNECSYSEDVVLSIKNLTTGHGLTENISFDLHKGEILGIGGLSHCGMHELGRAIFGEEKIVTGSVTHVPSGEIIANARVAMRHNMGYVSKDRDREALVLTSSIRENIVAAGFDKVSTGPLILPHIEKKYVQEQVKSLSIKCASIDQPVKSLSGGNKQKVVFGKWMGRKSYILILDCPTRGVDIGVKAAMYALMEEMKKSGKSILMISEELTELIGMCDRLLIIKDGHITGELKRGEVFDETAVIECMI